MSVREYVYTRHRLLISTTEDESFGFWPSSWWSRKHITTMSYLSKRRGSETKRLVIGCRDRQYPIKYMKGTETTLRQNQVRDVLSLGGCENHCFRGPHCLFSMSNVVVPGDWNRNHDGNFFDIHHRIWVRSEVHKTVFYHWIETPTIPRDRMVKTPSAVEEIGLSRTGRFRKTDSQQGRRKPKRRSSRPPKKKATKRIQSKTRRCMPVKYEFFHQSTNEYQDSWDRLGLYLICIWCR